MKYFLLLLSILFLSSCSNIKYDRDVWLKDSVITKMDFNNPRSQMIDDVLKNHLKVGMSLEEVHYKLGYIEPSKFAYDKPSSSYISKDSVSAKNIIGLTYFIGPTLGDYELLTIELDENNLVKDFWVRSN
tara:strand:- start:78 stop:467 length:390 start_codon:yes stop_codon:yes gene_type:complete